MSSIKMKHAAVLMAVTMAAFSASAQDVMSWGKETHQSYNTCSFVGTAAKVMNQVGADDIGRSRDCVEGKLALAKASFEPLVSQQKARAAAALKDYYVAWIAAMKSVPSRLADSSRASDTADTSTKQRLDELWARFEIEAGQ